MKIGVWAGMAALLAAAACDSGSGTTSGAPNSEVTEPRATSPRFTVTESQFDHDETMRRLYQAIDRRDLTIFAVIDHAAGAQAAELDLKASTVVIFGSPNVGTQLMQAEPLMAGELPLRAAVFEDEEGKVKVAVTSMNAIGRAYPSLEGQQQRLSNIRDNLAALSQEATGADG